MVIALPVLFDILFWVGCLIFIFLCLQITKAFFKITGTSLGWIPGVGGWLKSGVHSIEQRIVSVMSAAVVTCDAQIGAAFHALARIIDWMGREINAHANLLSLLASLLLGAAPVELVKLLTGEIRRAVRAVTHMAIQAQARTVTITRTITRSVAVDVLPRLRTAERELGRVIARDIPRIRSADRTLGREITNLWKWTRAHTLQAGSLAFAGAVALALGRLGLGWTRCSKVGQAGKNLCGMDAGLLESLLADSLVVVGSLSLVEFAEEMVGVTDLAVRPITDFWRAS